MEFSRFLNQTAVRWEFDSHDGYGGLTFASSPEEISVRWSDKTRLFINHNGEEEVSHTTVLSTTELKTNDYLYLGELSDIASSDLDNPEELSGACRIKQVNETPTIDAEQILYKAFVGRS